MDFLQTQEQDEQLSFELHYELLMPHTFKKCGKINNNNEKQKQNKTKKNNQKQEY